MKYFIFLLFLLFNNSYSQLYHRVPKNDVSNVIDNFIYNNNLNDCFQYLERIDQLYLKCWKDNMLYDVEIISKPYRKYIPEYSLSVSV